MARQNYIDVLIRMIDAARFQRDADRSAAAVQRIGRAAEQTSRSSSSAFNSMKRWVAGGAIAYGLGNIARQAITAGINFDSFRESSQLSFETLLGSASDARDMLAEIQRLNLHTSFQLPQLTGAAQQLLAVGFAAEDVIPTLRTMSDIAAANPLLGGEALDRMAVVFGQIRSTGRLMAQDALQLISLNIPVWQILADHYHTTLARVRKMSEQGLIDSTTALDAILAYSSDRFAGLADKQSRTFAGLMSNMTDLWGQFMGLVLQPFMAPLERQMEHINTLLQDPANQQAMAHLTADVGSLAKSTAQISANLASIDASEGRGVLHFLAVDVHLLAGALGLAARLMSSFTTTTQMLLGPFGQLLAMFRTIGQVADNWNRLFVGMTTPLDAIKATWSWLEQHARLNLSVSVPGGGVLGSVTGVVGRALNPLSGIPHFAVGGAMQFAGPALVGERGPELVHLPARAQVTPVERAKAEAALVERQPIHITVVSQMDGREVGRGMTKVWANEGARR